MINFQVYKNGVSIDCDYDYEALKIFDFNTLFIFHGLFGRGKNWQTFSKLLTKNEELNRNYGRPKKSRRKCL